MTDDDVVDAPPSPTSGKPNRTERSVAAEALRLVRRCHHWWSCTDGLDRIVIRTDEAVKGIRKVCGGRSCRGACVRMWRCEPSQTSTQECPESCDGVVTLEGEEHARASAQLARGERWASSPAEHAPRLAFGEAGGAQGDNLEALCHGVLEQRRWHNLWIGCEECGWDDDEDHLRETRCLGAHEAPRRCHLDTRGDQWVGRGGGGGRARSRGRMWLRWGREGERQGGLSLCGPAGNEDRIVHVIRAKHGPQTEGRDALGARGGRGSGERSQ
mmetsp:Transcript_10385/g.30819  ORF Transcript_10385/g.30819 Transcript_10385/m.30819 type:complete len:271 (-) Transcript_10385:744-1556(-)